MTDYNWRIDSNGLIAEFKFRNAEERNKFCKLGESAELVKAERGAWYNNPTLAWATAFLALIAVWLMGVWKVMQ